MNYTDVTPIQLFGGWILAGALIVACAVPLYKWFYWKAAALFNKAMGETATAQLERNWGIINDLHKIIDGRDSIIEAANDKVRSLEAQIDRIISRPRGKSGRFERAKK